MMGVNGKRIGYFASSCARIFGFLALLIGYIVVKITVSPSIEWLNVLLLSLAIAGLVSGIFNLIMCGFTASGYNDKKALQIVCFIITLLTGGIFGSTFTGIAVFTRVTKEEMENEKIVKVK